MNDKKQTSEDYEEGWNDGFYSATKRITQILKKFPLQCAAITPEIEQLHPSQPSRLEEMI